MDIKLLIFIIFVVSVVVYSILNPDNCPKCKAKLKVDRIKDPWGINITKTIVLTLRRFGAIDTYYVCTNCGKEYVRKRDSSRLESL